MFPSPIEMWHGSNLVCVLKCRGSYNRFKFLTIFIGTLIFFTSTYETTKIIDQISFKKKNY